MDETSLANERLALPVFRFLKHPQDLWAVSISTAHHIRMWFDHRAPLYRWNGGEDQHAYLAKGLLTQNRNLYFSWNKIIFVVGRRFLSQRPMVFVRHQYAILPVDIRHSSSTRAHSSCFICLFLSFHSPISSSFDHDSFHSRFPEVFHAKITNQSNFQVKL